MKCPDCGFECLPDDIECLACGTNIPAAVENKKKEKKRSLEAANRQAEYEHKFRKELGLIDDEEEYIPPSGHQQKKTLKKKVNIKQQSSTKPPQKKTKKVPPVKKIKKCPKCGFQASRDDVDCMKCGIIFNKFKTTEDSQTTQKKIEQPPELKKRASDIILASNDEQHEYENEETDDDVYDIEELEDIEEPDLEELDLSDLRLETEEEKNNRYKKRPVDPPEDKTDEINLTALDSEAVAAATPLKETNDVSGGQMAEGGEAQSVEKIAVTTDSDKVADESGSVNTPTSEIAPEGDPQPDSSSDVELADNPIPAEDIEEDDPDKTQILKIDDEPLNEANTVEGESTEPEGQPVSEDLNSEVLKNETDSIVDTSEPEGEIAGREAETVEETPVDSFDATVIIDVNEVALEAGQSIETPDETGDDSDLPDETVKETNEISEDEEDNLGGDVEPEVSLTVSTDESVDEETVYATEEKTEMIETPVVSADTLVDETVGTIGAEPQIPMASEEQVEALDTDDVGESSEASDVTDSIIDDEPHVIEIDSDNFEDDKVQVDEQALVSAKESLILAETEKDIESLPGLKDKAALTLKGVIKNTAKVGGRMKDSVKKLFGNLKGGNNRKKLYITIAIAVIGICITIPLSVNYYQKVKAARIERERVERLENIKNEFIANETVIVNKIRQTISKKSFATADSLINDYDIESLQDRLAGVKNYLKEIRLYEVIRKVPGREYGKNYNMFLDIIKLNPTNKKYSTKRDYYKKKYAASEYTKASKFLRQRKGSFKALNEAIDHCVTAVDLYPANRNYKGLLKQLKTKKLMFPEGNDKLIMAVMDNGMGKRLFAGQRKLTVWLKNVSNEDVYINVQYFSMTGKNKKEYSYSDMGREFKGRLTPGEQTRGELYFKTRTKPKKIVFSHLVCGEIYREFP